MLNRSGMCSVCCIIMYLLDLFLLRVILFVDQIVYT